MKKVLYFISLLALTVIPNITSAHYSGSANPADCSIGTRAEVSKDNGTTWYSYDSSDAPSLNSGYTEQVARGDNIKIRVRVWNEGSSTCNFTIAGTKTGFDSLENVTLGNVDEDGDTVDMIANVDNVGFSGIVNAGGSATTGYESVLITGKVKSDAVSGTAINLSYNITDTSVGEFNQAYLDKKSLLQQVIERLTPKAYADSDGTSTSAVRMLVNVPTAATTVTELPKTGQSAYFFLIPIVFILSAYFLIRRVASKSSR